MCGSTSVVKVLCNFKADCNTRDLNNLTPLHYAANFSSKECAVILCTNGADTNAKTKYDWTPLHYAVKNNNR